MTAPFLLRRSKSQVLQTFLKRMKRLFILEMEDEQRKLYLAAQGKSFVDQLQGIDSVYYEKNKIFIPSQLTKLSINLLSSALATMIIREALLLEACMEPANSAVKENIRYYCSLSLHQC